MPATIEVPVEPLDPILRQQGELQTHSALFREDTRLSTVLDLALESRSDIESSRPLIVLSVGSSFGAEADSTIAYITKTAPNIGRITLIGLDVNPFAVEQAKQAKYIAHQPAIKTTDGFVKMDLGEHLTMFQVTPSPAGKDQYIVDSSALRAQHDVTFLQADLAKDKIDIPQADIILCNNLLFHLDAQSAERLVKGMTKHLALGGIMSFGANPKQVKMSGNRDNTDYPEWRRHIVDELVEDGIEPVLYDTARKAPFVFRKVR